VGAEESTADCSDYTGSLIGEETENRIREELIRFLVFDFNYGILRIHGKA